jgi:hypothetical protein
MYPGPHRDGEERQEVPRQKNGSGDPSANGGEAGPPPPAPHAAARAMNPKEKRQALHILDALIEREQLWATKG